MLLLAAILSAVTVVTVPAQNKPLPSLPQCSRTTAQVAVQRGRTPPARKLTELPPANMYSAVYRRVDGCEKPIVVRYNVGRG